LKQPGPHDPPGLSTLIHEFIKVLITGREQVILFPLTLTLSPIGGEGIKKQLV